jgi:hypothetical protein
MNAAFRVLEEQNAEVARVYATIEAGELR